MSTATKPRINKASKALPKVEVGDIILWWHGGLTSNAPLPAIVVHDGGQGNLDIHVFRRHDTIRLGGVKHRDDPRLNQTQKGRSGCWDVRK